MVADRVEVLVRARHPQIRPLRDPWFAESFGRFDVLGHNIPEDVLSEDSQGDKLPALELPEVLMPTTMTITIPDDVFPSGSCFCGCGGKTEPTRFFLRHHDRKAESGLLNEFYDGLIAKLLVAHGLGPNRTSQEAPKDADGVELHVGDRVLANGRRGTVRSVRREIAVFDSDDGSKRSARFERINHVLEEAR